MIRENAHMYIHMVMKKKIDIARSSAQQRGARPHDQYDKADRGALERTGTGGLERSRIDGRYSSHQQEVWCLCWRCAFAEQMHNATAVTKPSSPDVS